MGYEVNNVLLIILLFRILTACAEVIRDNGCALEIAVSVVIAVLVGMVYATVMNLIFINR